MSAHRLAHVEGLRTSRQDNVHPVPCQQRYDGVGRKKFWNGTQMSVSGSPGDTIRRLVLAGDPPVLHGDEVFVRTRLGRNEVAYPSEALPRRLRMLLLLIDGRRTVDDFRTGLNRYRGLEDALDMLRKMNMIESLQRRLDG
jgi:hypothetical protein